MSLSLIIYEHPTPAETYPLLATRDPVIIATLRELILERLGDEQPTPPMRLVTPCQMNPHEAIP